MIYSCAPRASDIPSVRRDPVGAGARSCLIFIAKSATSSPTGHVASHRHGVARAREREISLRRCPLSYQVSTACRNFCSPGHVQPRNRYAEEKISMIIATRTAGTPTRGAKLDAGHNGAAIGPSLLISRHPARGDDAAGDPTTSTDN